MDDRKLSGNIKLIFLILLIILMIIQIWSFNEIAGYQTFSRTSMQLLTSAQNTGGQSQSLQMVNTSIQGPRFEVVKVVDGDTVDIQFGDKIRRVRLIGINTPETVDPRRSVQCFGKEASAKAKSVLLNHSVFVEADPAQGDKDKYGRLLRYLFLEDGTNFNKWMIAEGYAFEYTYRIPYKYQDEFKEAQRLAREEGRGLWAENACNGQR